MNAKLISKLVLAAALLGAGPALASDATDTESGFSSNGATVYPVFAAKEVPPAPAPQKDAPAEEEARDGACECHG